MRDLKLSSNLLPEEMHFIYRHGEFEANISVVLRMIYVAFHFIRTIFLSLLCSNTNIISIKTVLQSEGMGDLKLFPCYDSGRTYFVGFDSESAVLVVEHMSLLCEYTGKKADDGPA